MEAPLVIALVIKFQMAMIMQASKSNASDEHIADFVVNLSKMNGKESSEINFISDMATFDVNYQHVHTVIIPEKQIF